jgi:hypothetical protein
MMKLTQMLSNKKSYTLYFGWIVMIKWCESVLLQVKYALGIDNGKHYTKWKQLFSFDQLQWLAKLGDFNYLSLHIENFSIRMGGGAYLGCWVTYASKTRGTLWEMLKYALHSDSGKHCIKWK